jgi:hypothetical protein
MLRRQTDEFTVRHSCASDDHSIGTVPRLGEVLQQIRINVWQLVFRTYKRVPQGIILVCNLMENLRKYHLWFDVDFSDLVSCGFALGVDLFGQKEGIPNRICKQRHDKWSCFMKMR